MLASILIRSVLSMRMKYLHGGDIALTFGEGAIVSPRSKRSKRLRIDLHASGGDLIPD